MAHKHSIYDSDTHFRIDPITRALRNESSTKTMLMQYDHNSERFTFEIPRMVEGHDMSLCDVVEIHYLNISTKTRETNAGIYEITDVQLSPESEDVVIGSWLISRNATKEEGVLNFLVRFACTTNGELDYVWSTGIYTGITISAGICNSEIVVEEYADILQQWRAELDAAIPVRGEDYWTEEDKAEIKAYVDGEVAKQNIPITSHDELVVNNYPSNVTMLIQNFRKTGHICQATIQFRVETAIRDEYGFQVISLPFSSNMRVWLGGGTQFFINGSERHIKVNSDQLAAGTYMLYFMYLTEQEEPTVPPQKITFTVNGTEYQAEEGMTWEAFLRSDYNVGDIFYKECPGVFWKVGYGDPMVLHFLSTPEGDEVYVYSDAPNDTVLAVIPDGAVYVA